MKTYQVEILVKGYFIAVKVQANNQKEAKKSARPMLLEEMEDKGIHENSRFKYNSIISL